MRYITTAKVPRMPEKNTKVTAVFTTMNNKSTKKKTTNY